MKRLLAIVALLFTAALARAQNGTIQGFCATGGVKVLTQGINSTTTVQASYPRCQVTVYLTGTTVKASIFTNAGGGVLGNPFTAGTDGKWLFYAATGAGYDVVMSGGVPLVMPGPVTLTNIQLTSGGGGGGSGCITTNTGLFLLSNGTGGCTVALADYGISADKTFSFSDSSFTITDADYLPGQSSIFHSLSCITPDTPDSEAACADLYHTASTNQGEAARFRVSLDTNPITVQPSGNIAGGAGEYDFESSGNGLDSNNFSIYLANTQAATPSHPNVSSANFQLDMSGTGPNSANYYASLNGQATSSANYNINLSGQDPTSGKFNLATTGASTFTAPSFTFTGPALFNNGITVNDPSAFNGGVTVAGGETVSGAALFNNSATITGATILNGGVTVVGGANVTGAAVFNSGVSVTGGSTVSGGETVNGLATLNGGANIVGPAVMGSGATVTGAAVFNSGVSVIGALGVSGAVSGATGAFPTTTVSSSLKVPYLSSSVNPLCWDGTNVTNVGCASATPGGSTMSLQYNNGGVFGGYSGTGVLRVATGLPPVAITGSQLITGTQGTSGTKLVVAAGTFVNGNARVTDALGNEVDGGLPLAAFPLLDGYNDFIWPGVTTFHGGLSTNNSVGHVATMGLTTDILATSVANQEPANFMSTGYIWNGSTSVPDQWNYAQKLGAGINPSSVLRITHTGSTGPAQVELPAIALTAALTATSATAGAGSALPVTPAGYLTININGTNYKIPYFNP